MSYVNYCLWLLLVLPVLYIQARVITVQPHNPVFPAPNTTCVQECEHNYYLCPDTQTCIYPHYRCDGVVDCPGSEDELNCYQYQQDKIAKTHFEKALEKAIKSATREDRKLLRGSLRNMNPDQLHALAKAVNEYVRSTVHY